MVFYAAFKIISDITGRQLTYQCISVVSPLLGYAMTCLFIDTTMMAITTEKPTTSRWLEPGTSMLHFTTEPRTTPGSLKVKSVSWKTANSTIILSCKISHNKKCLLLYYFHRFIFSFYELSFINLKPLYSQFKGR